MARPKKYTEELISKIVKKIEAYTDAEDIPVLKEFCYKNHILKQTLYEHEGFSDSIKRLIDKKEAQLEIKALKGKVAASIAIFSLKQLGWTDKKEIEHSGGVTIVMDKDDSDL